MGQSREATLATGSTTLDVVVNDQSEVRLTGTFGSVVLSDTTETVIEDTITAAKGFSSVMTEMRFVLTGTGPVLVKITPLREGNVSKMEVTA